MTSFYHNKKYLQDFLRIIYFISYFSNIKKVVKSI